MAKVRKEKKTAVGQLGRQSREPGVFIPSLLSAYRSFRLSPAGPDFTLARSVYTMVGMQLTPYRREIGRRSKVSVDLIACNVLSSLAFIVIKQNKGDIFQCSGSIAMLMATRSPPCCTRIKVLCLSVSLAVGPRSGIEPTLAFKLFQFLFLQLQYRRTGSM